MAKLYYRFGAMGSSKTAQALMTKFNYEECGRRVLLLKPAVDTRDGAAVIKSRIGLSAKATLVQNVDSIAQIFADSPADVIVVDECQFLTRVQVQELRKIASEQDIPVLCFGLRTDFRARLFEGSAALFELADSVTEVKSVCRRCGAKAIINARLVDGCVTTAGNQVDIGGNDKYQGMCWHCWNELTHNRD